MRVLTPSILFILAISIVWACDQRTIQEPSLAFDYEYFPLDVGDFWEYEVDSFIYRPGQNGGVAIDSIQSQLREVVVDTFRDNANLLNFIVEQYTRRSTDAPWQVRNVLRLARNEEQAFRVEDNLRFLKMVFPPKADRSWPGTNYFDEFTAIPVAGGDIEVFKGWESTILTRDGFWQAGDLSFEEVLEIEIADFNTFIERREGKEYYAKDVGLISRSLTIFDTQCQICCGGDCGDRPWEEKAELGFVIEQKLIRYKK